MKYAIILACSAMLACALPQGTGTGDMRAGSPSSSDDAVKPTISGKRVMTSLRDEVDEVGRPKKMRHPKPADQKKPSGGPGLHPELPKWHGNLPQTALQWIDTNCKTQSEGQAFNETQCQEAYLKCSIEAKGDWVIYDLIPCARKKLDDEISTMEPNKNNKEMKNESEADPADDQCDSDADKDNTIPSKTNKEVKNESEATLTNDVCDNDDGKDTMKHSKIDKEVKDESKNEPPNVTNSGTKIDPPENPASVSKPVHPGRRPAIQWSGRRRGRRPTWRRPTMQRLNSKGPLKNPVPGKQDTQATPASEDRKKQPQPGAPAPSADNESQDLKDQKLKDQKLKDDIFNSTVPEPEYKTLIRFKVSKCREESAKHNIKLADCIEAFDECTHGPLRPDSVVLNMPDVKECLDRMVADISKAQNDEDGGTEGGEKTKPASEESVNQDKVGATEADKKKKPVPEESINQDNSDAAEGGEKEGKLAPEDPVNEDKDATTEAGKKKPALKTPVNQDKDGVAEPGFETKIPLPEDATESAPSSSVKKDLSRPNTPASSLTTFQAFIDRVCIGRPDAECADLYKTCGEELGQALESKLENVRKLGKCKADKLDKIKGSAQLDQQLSAPM